MTEVDKKHYLIKQKLENEHLLQNDKINKKIIEMNRIISELIGTTEEAVLKRC
jgi:hypothetical protein